MLLWTFLCKKYGKYDISNVGYSVVLCLNYLKQTNYLKRNMMSYDGLVYAWTTWNTNQQRVIKKHLILTNFIPWTISRGNITDVSKPTKVNFSMVVLGSLQSGRWGLAELLHHTFTAKLRSTDETWWNLVYNQYNSII